MAIHDRRQALQRFRAGVATEQDGDYVLTRASETSRRIAVVIVNWDSWEDTERCVSSLLADTLEAVSIVVIDNGSNPERSLPASLRQRVRLVRLVENIGFAAAANLGLRMAVSGDFDAVLLLNPDALISMSSIRILHDTLNSSQCLGAVGPILVRDSRGELRTAGGSLSMLALRTTQHRTASFPPDVDFKEVDYVEGSCIMLKTSALARVGLFDESFFVYWEEVDLCRRLRMSGFAVACAVKATAFHAPKRYETPWRAYLYLKSTLRFAEKHYPRHLAPFLPMSLISGFLPGFISLAKKHPVQAARVLARVATELPSHVPPPRTNPWSEPW